jgi:hypothetical protein
MELHRPQGSYARRRVSVPGYNLFNLGARYTPGGEQGRVTLSALCQQHRRQALLEGHRRKLRRYVHLAGRADDGAALGALHFLDLVVSGEEG